MSIILGHHNRWGRDLGTELETANEAAVVENAVVENAVAENAVVENGEEVSSGN